MERSLFSNSTLVLTPSSDACHVIIMGTEVCTNTMTARGDAVQRYRGRPVNIHLLPGVHSKPFSLVPGDDDAFTVVHYLVFMELFVAFAICPRTEKVSPTCLSD